MALHRPGELAPPLRLGRLRKYYSFDLTLSHFLPRRASAETNKGKSATQAPDKTLSTLAYANISACAQTIHAVFGLAYYDTQSSTHIEYRTTSTNNEKVAYVRFGDTPRQFLSSQASAKPTNTTKNSNTIQMIQAMFDRNSRNAFRSFAGSVGRSLVSPVSI